MKLRNIIFALSFLALYGSQALADTIYDLTWTCAVNCGSQPATATGVVNFTNLSAVNNGFNALPASNTNFTGISAFSFVLGSNTYSIANGLITQIYRTNPIALNPSVTSNVISQFNVLNFFTNNSLGLGSNYGNSGQPNQVSTNIYSGGMSIFNLSSVIYFGTTGPSSADTQASLQNTASALQNTYTLQNSVLANSFSYDCNVFGENDVCVSAGGRNTAVSAANGLNNTSGLLIAAYRALSNVRVGAYADQNLSVNNAGSTVNLGNNTRLIGLFAAWDENTDGTGTEVKVSAAYGQKNTTITRQVVGTSEAGTGGSQLNSQGAQVVAKYGFGLADNFLVSPYAGIRYTQNNMGGYTENASSAVTAPLTYSALNTNATTLLAGIGASYKGIPQTTLVASAGVETDTNTSNGSLNATNATIGTLTPVNFNANPVTTRPTAMLGAYYDVEKNQRVGLTGIYRQEAYQAVSTTTVMATYTVGF